MPSICDAPCQTKEYALDLALILLVDQHIACARSLWDINHGLAKELEDATLVEESLRANEDEKSSSERLRKLARMQVVRAKKDNLELIDSKMKVRSAPFYY